MNDAPARLIGQQGQYRNQEFELTQAEMSIGRSPDNEITLPDPEISRRHAQITRQGNEYAIRDLGSTNGTFVNSQRITTLTPLYDGDVINLGDAISLLFAQRPKVEEPERQRPLPGDDDTPTGDLEPLPPEAFSRQPPQPAQAPSPPPPPPQREYGRREEEVAVPPPETSTNRRRLILGCGCALIAIVCLCAATVLFLDAYDQGRLLYCGPVRPLFETILGSAFAPTCP